MAILILITTLLVKRAATSCSHLDDAALSPFKQSYDEDDVVTLKCKDPYVISWAESADQAGATVKCDSTRWVREPAVQGFTGTVACVACVKDKVDCTDGTCGSDGVCVCDNDGYKLSLRNPRLCEPIKCNALTLSNQHADSAGPYDVGTEVKVTCTDGFHVKGEDTAKEQIITCTKEGHFDKTLKPCVVCVDDNDCKDGTCNANGACECDETAGYKLSKDDKRRCEKTACTADYCSNNGVCSVKGIELSCDCKTGTTGDTCADFTTNPCEENPCKNEGKCTRDMSNPEDYTKHRCTCGTGFKGEDCEEEEAVQDQDGKKGDNKNGNSAACIHLLGNIISIVAILVNIF